MSSVKWTKEQEQAIYEKGSHLLVAAAAGSGKTAVLVERMIHKVIEEGIDIDKLLVVTFTNAAASEMRQRLLEAIYQKIDENPNDIRLQRQITLLNKASICTIHSFCLDVIRNYFFEIDTTANFRIGDTGEIDLLKQQVLEELMEEKYENKDADFEKLVCLYSNYRDDESLKDLVLQIYRYMQSMPFPEKWIEEQVQKFNRKENEDFAKTQWGELLLQDLKENVREARIKLQHSCQRLMHFLPETQKFVTCLQSDCVSFQTLEALLENGATWDQIYERAHAISFEKWPVDKKCTVEAKEEAKEIRDEIRKKWKEQVQSILVGTSELANKEMAQMYPILKSLSCLVLEFSKAFAKAKKERNTIDFNDIEHFALRILVKEGPKGEILPTEAAKQIQEKFEEIAIDEYQDSNMVQEYILNSVSKGNNMFMVGDVKQSIYKFRQARPELFLEKYANYREIEEKAEGRKIKLFKNFRSRSNILDVTNLVFTQIMSQKLGDMDYTQKEYLNLGANYPEPENSLPYAGNSELMIIDLAQKEEADEEEENQTVEKVENTLLEARLVAKRIKELEESGYQVYDRKKGGYRPITYKDIVILLRSTVNSAPLFEKELLQQGFPVFSDTSEEYLDSVEIQTILCVLKILDNPLQDIPLVTIMRSPIGNFTDNDLVEIRMIERSGCFYDAVVKARGSVREDLQEKIDLFLKQLEEWREAEEEKSLDELIWQIYTDTNYFNYVGLLPNGGLKQANLKLLFEKAKQYEEASFKGLFPFIHFIDSLKANSGDMQAAKIIGENENVIRIMSIHKSKGLEFPVVFLCGTSKRFNMLDLNQPVLLHQELGFGPNGKDLEKKIEYNTLAKEAIKIKAKQETIAEEMRILYVALTRAKEKLIITGVSKDLQKDWKEKEADLSLQAGEKIPEHLLKKKMRYLDWLEYVYLNTQKGKEDKVIDLVEIPFQQLLSQEESRQEENSFLRELEQTQSDTTIQKQIQNCLEWNYDFLDATTMLAKTSATEYCKMQEEEIDTRVGGKQERKTEFKQPKFAKKETTITQAQKGTLMHLCMQKMDPKKEYEEETLRQMVQELVEKEIIQEEEAKQIAISSLFAYTKSNLWKELQQAKSLAKEAPFYISIPEKEGEEEILVQGIIDLYFITKEDQLVLVDYKTDFVSSIGGEEKLKKKYCSQLALYEKALEQSLQRKVDKKIIYSVYLQKEIEIKE